MSKHTLESITKLYQKTFFIEDTSPIALVAAVIISSRLHTNPVWLYIIGPSSGGKSVLIEAFSKVKYLTQVSDLTPNTFLSGMANGKEEPSLLKRLGLNFVITMKDFTTILSKPDEAQQAIISQMREIYDGYIVKYTGNGKKIEWGGETPATKGKATFIMAATEGIHAVQEKFSDMGTRAINYVLKPQDRIKTCKQSLRNNNNLVEEMENIQVVFNEYITEMLDNMPDKLPELPEELEDQIIEVADFSSIGRSVVKRDYRGVKNLALSPEMPMRMAKQLLVMCQVFTYMSGGTLPEHLKNCVFKIGLDSIPKQRRLVLEVLAKYRRVNISGIADLINYSPDRTREWIEDLNMFDVVRRVREKNQQFWQMKDEYRNIMVKYLGIEPVEMDLEGDDADGYSEHYAGGGNYADEDLSYEAREDIIIRNIEQENIWENISKEPSGNGLDVTS